MENIEINFTAHAKNYRIRAMDKHNLILEYQTPKAWALMGYYNAYSLRRALLDIVTEDIKGELFDLFREQNRLLNEIEKQINIQFPNQVA